MEKQEHGSRLAAAMAGKGAGREQVADATGVHVRTVSNWTKGNTMPSAIERSILRGMFPGYDTPGDPVEAAVMRSELSEDRQHAVLSTYKRLLREQSEGSSNAG